MGKKREILLILLCLLLFAAGFFAVNELTNSPYSDAQIRESLVDTWQANAIFTMFAFALLLFSIVSAAVLGFRHTRTAKRLSITAISAPIAIASILVVSHAKLTERTTGLTGQEFGRFYGLL